MHISELAVLTKYHNICDKTTECNSILLYRNCAKGYSKLEWSLMSSHNHSVMMYVGLDGIQNADFGS